MSPAIDKSYLPGAEANTLRVVSKLRLDPKKMCLDLNDSTFVEATVFLGSGGIDANTEARIDLTGTLFKFTDGSKVATGLSSSDLSLKIKIDDEAL